MSEPEELIPVLSEGDRLAPGFTVVAHLSRNRRLDVYDVWSDERQCRCVAKLLRPDQRGNRHAAKRLLREGSMLKQIAHPNIVRAYEVLKRPQPVVILETLKGETLSHLIDRRRRRRLPLRELAHLGLQLGSAVQYLHSRGMLHLDVKPSNVVANEGRATLIDLSVARPPGFSRKSRGTRPYMAPEQFGWARLTPATDVWGIGATLYATATAVSPFEAGDGAEPGAERRAAPIGTHRRMPDEVASVLDACLDPDPGGRPTTAELMRALEAVVADDMPGTAAA